MGVVVRRLLMAGGRSGVRLEPKRRQCPAIRPFDDEVGVRAAVLRYTGSFRAEGVEVSELADWRRRVYVATFGEPPATSAFIAALHSVIAIRRHQPWGRDENPRRVIGDDTA